jgi:hypothetical protein
MQQTQVGPTVAATVRLTMLLELEESCSTQISLSNYGGSQYMKYQNGLLDFNLTQSSG